MGDEPRPDPGLVLVALIALGPSAAGVEQRGPVDAIEIAGVFHRGDYAQTIALARERLKQRPDEVQTRILLGRAEAASGRFEAAYHEFQKALRLDGRNPDALYYLGITSGVLAQGRLDHVIALAPQSARARQLLAESHQAQGRLTQAEAEYRAALEASPEALDVLVALGDLLRSQSRFDEAAEHYARAARLAPRHYDAVYGLGVCHSYRQEHGRAIELFREALRLAPDSPPARLALGHSLLQNGQTLAAVEELRAARTLEPRMRQAHYLLGRAYRTLGRSREADAEFARAQELQRSEAEAAEAALESSETLVPEDRRPPDAGSKRP